MSMITSAFFCFCLFFFLEGGGGRSQFIVLVPLKKTASEDCPSYETTLFCRENRFVSWLVYETGRV